MVLIKVHSCRRVLLMKQRRWSNSSVDSSKSVFLQSEKMEMCSSILLEFHCVFSADPNREQQYHADSSGLLFRLLANGKDSFNSRRAST
mmetsp:Transcript_39723/g.61988  ORF Transcript_39723/g.61988 Transcript_39723/m.61988 type:complete len:89 (+) Transcript_39723:1194-1460(+)